MAENSQLSDETKNNSTDTSSTDVSSAVIGNHKNAIVPHKISNHDKLVQTMVMVDGEWINVNDTNDQANVKYDMHKVNKKVVEAQKGIVEAKSAADSAAKTADSAVSASVVNSDAITAQSAAISEAKSAINSAAAEIQQTAANAASDAAKIRADVAQVQNEVNTAKAANSASVEALKSDISAAKQDLVNVHDSLTKAQAAAEESQKAIDKSIAQINSDIEQGRKDIASAQQANADTAKQLDTYSKQAQDQGKTIKSIQDKQDGFTTTLADVQGNVTQVSGKVDGLSAGLKDAQDNVASIKVQADQLSATLTDHAKSIATLTASAKELSSTLEDADGRLSKVEQTAQTNSSTLSDVQGDLSQVKQDATTLTATLKDAQGNISTLQQKADSISAQLASAQGDIASLQTDVTGIKATLVSHEDDIHTLQADSKTLKDDMQDAQGDISTLKKTSTDVTSELKDHAGRISKNEQTASALVNELADQQGHLNRVEQTAQGTQQTVANQQGQINTIKTDAAGIHQALTGQGNQIANINVTLSGLNTKYEDVSGDLNNLKSQAQWATVTSAVDLNNVKTPCHEFLKGAVTNAPNEAAWWYLTVEGSESGRITQTVIADQSNNRYTRRWADGWSAWVKDATQTDVTALSDRITTNSTQTTQNKQAIALKADQATVNNLSGQVSQAQAQLKVQAGQISSKVSSTDFKTLNDKVNGMKIGGRNLLQGTAKIDFPIYKNGGTQTIQKYDDETNYIQHTSDTPLWCMGPWWQLTPEVGQIYTLSADVCGNGYIPGGIFHYEGGEAGSLGRVDLTNDWQRISNTFRVNTISGNWIIYANNSTLLKVKHIKIEKGNVATDWTPAPEDTITAIQKNSAAIDQTNKQISLKADQTEVDQVKQTATQNSSRLDVMAGEIKSKVTSTDVNNIVDKKGYATTSTVQSLITQKAGTLNESITNLTTELKNNSGGGVNLLLNTGTLQFSANVTSQTNNPNSADSLWHLSVGSLAEWLKDNPNITKLGISYDYELTGTTKASGIIRFGVNQAPVWEYMSGYNLDGKPLKGRAKIIIDVTDAMRNTRTDITRIRGDGLPIGATLKITHPKWEIGAVTPYSQAPSDNASVNQLQSVTASIDGLQSAVKNKVDQSQYTQLAGLVQTKVSQSDFNVLKSQVQWTENDNIDFNNCKTQMNVFTKSVKNAPNSSYWWYLRVEPGINGRVTQYATSDRDNKHYTRQWISTNWTAWSQGANESEITQLRNDINLRVKSGDLLSQINIEAGRQLFQAKKIYFDADSFVLGPQAKAFIPSAYITNLSADKINTGTLHSISINNGNGKFTVDSNGNVVANSIHVNNGSIYQGQILGADLYSISNLASNSLNSVNDATQNWVKLKNGTIELHGANGNHYSSIMPVDMSTAWNNGSAEEHHGLGILDSEEVIIGQAALYSDNNHRITHNTNLSMINRTNLTISSSVIQATLAPDWGDGKGTLFSIQKDNKIGAYFGSGNHGNELNITTAGDGNRIHFIANNFDINSEVNIQNHGLTVRDLHVTNWLGVDGSKNSVVKTSQGTVTINAYETAEYYFGDIGENRTNNDGIAYVGIEKLFNELINTDIPYQVFLTAYGPGNLWVEQREHDRFVVKSDQPNIKFGWEIKAKRKGYEHTRLQNVDDKLNHMEATS